MSSPGAPASWLQIRRLEPHIAEVVDGSEQGSAAQQAAALDLAVRAAGAIMQAGSHTGADALLRALLPDLVRHLGADHPETLRCRAGLVRLARLDGRLADAAVGAERLVVDQRRVQGDDAVDTLRARHEHGLVLIARGDRDRGHAVLRSVLTDRLRLIDDDHPETLATRRALG